MAIWTPPPPPPEQEWVSRRLRLPNDEFWQALVDGVLSKLLDQWYYVQTTGITPLETIEIMGKIWLEYGETDVYQLGVVIPYMTADPPPFTIPCDGATYNRVDYPNLYAVLDPVFIIDADTFKTPLLPGRTIIGAGEAESGTTYTVGQEVGEEFHALTADENATHSHTDSGHFHTYQPPGITGLAVAPGELPVTLPNIIPGLTGSASANIQSSGASEPHENRQPSTALKFAVYAR